jgi:predicted metalloprotease
MRFQRSGRLSSNIQDRRGRSGSRRPGGVAIGGGGLGLGAILLFFLTQVLGGGGGGELGQILEQLGPQVGAPAAPGEDIPTGGEATGEDDALVSFVLDDAQALWTEQFQQTGRTYEPAVLVLYERGTDTAGCGYGQAAAGPFYCPADERIYIDLSFFDDLASRFGAPGDFAQAYVVAHEIAHHVQNQLGISTQVRQQQQADPEAANDLSVRLELQADCLAGVWAYSAFDDQVLEEGDLEEGLAAAAAVGDDTIQSQAGASVNPETWTHGSSEQRVRWFRTGFDSGDPNACDTFAGDI